MCICNTDDMKYIYIYIYISFPKTGSGLIIYARELALHPRTCAEDSVAGSSAPAGVDVAASPKQLF